MPITEAFTGSETVSTTEWSLTTDTAGPDADTSDGVFQAYLELNALAAGDVYEFKVHEKVQAGSTQRIVYSAVFADVQSPAVWVSERLMLMHGWDMTLDKISGTDRLIAWSIRKSDGGLDAAGIRSAVGLAAANLDTQLTTIDDLLDTEVAAIKAKTDNLPAAPAAVGDVPTANANADALLDRAAGVETGLTVRQAFRLVAAVLLGKASGLGTTTAVYRDTGDTKDRVTATVDTSGNRSAVTKDAT